MSRNRGRTVRSAVAASVVASFLLAAGGVDRTGAQSKPEGEMRWALYVTMPPAWFDPGEVTGTITPFWVLDALHDALVKPMPGNLTTPSLAESWTVSPDQRAYEFKLREGVKFHNGDPFTAEDVRFSFQRAKGTKILREKVKEVVWDPKSPWHDRRVRLASILAVDAKAINEAENLGASRLTGALSPRSFEFTLPLAPFPHDPARAKRLLAEAGYPNGLDAGDLYPYPPYTSMGEAVAGYLGAVGIRTRIRTMERAAFVSAWASKKLSGVCVCISALYGNAASRLSEFVPSTGMFSRGVDADVDDLYRQQARETDRKKREAMLHRIQQLLYERVRFGPVYEYIWPSAVGRAWPSLR